MPEQPGHKVTLIWAARRRVRQGWLIGRHHHACWQAVVVGSGSLFASFGSDQRLLGASDAVLIRPERPHALFAQEPAEVLEVKFLVHDERLLTRLGHVPDFLPAVEPDAINALKRLVSEGEEQAQYYTELAANAVEEFLLRIARSRPARVCQAAGRAGAPAEPRGRARPRAAEIGEVIAYMRECLGEELSLRELGKRFGYNPTYLCEKFAAAVGKPPKRYLIELRIKKGEELLTQTDLPVRDIALAIGYASLQHFSRAFKKETGLSPRAFRRLHRAESDVEVVFVDLDTATRYGLQQKPPSHLYSSVSFFYRQGRRRAEANL